MTHTSPQDHLEEPAHESPGLALAIHLHRRSTHDRFGETFLSTPRVKCPGRNEPSSRENPLRLPRTSDPASKHRRCHRAASALQLNHMSSCYRRSAAADLVPPQSKSRGPSAARSVSAKQS